MTFARAALATGLLLSSPAAASPEVVADVAPIHSIVANVMEGAGEPHLLLPPGASPHHYALHPSEAAALERADVVFWVGEAYTPWLADPIATLAADARALALEDAPGLRLLPTRKSGPFAHAPHDEAGHVDEDHGHAHGHAEGRHEHEAIDGHLWLDPLNAAAIARAAADALADADPAHADLYRRNAESFAAEMDALVARLDDALTQAEGRRFVVFHDAYQYFEDRFDLPASGSIALHDADQPSAARMAEIRDRIRAEQVACVFAEPQFPASLIATAVEGTGARRGSLDPIGVDFEPGPGFYPLLISGLAADLLACLTDPATPSGD